MLWLEVRVLSRNMCNGAAGQHFPPAAPANIPAQSMHRVANMPSATQCEPQFSSVPPCCQPSGSAPPHLFPSLRYGVCSPYRPGSLGLPLIFCQLNLVLQALGRRFTIRRAPCHMELLRCRHGNHQLLRGRGLCWGGNKKREGQKVQSNSSWWERLQLITTNLCPFSPLMGFLSSHCYQSATMLQEQDVTEAGGWVVYFNLTHGLG